MDVLLAMCAHHAFDFECLFHGFCLFLWFVRGNFGGNGGFCRCGMVGGRSGRMIRLEEVEPQGVQHDADAREAHGRRADHRRKLDAEGWIQHASRDGDADDVVDERPEKIFLDVPEHRFRQADRADGVEEVALHEHGVRALDRNVRAGADGDAKIRLRERRRVVDAVADHGDAMAVCLELLHHACFAARQHACDDVIDVHAFAHGLCRARVVAREHDDVDAHLLEFCNGRATRLLRLVRCAEHADDALILREQQRRRTVVRERVEVAGQLRRVRAELSQERGVARRIAMAIRLRCHALAERRGKVRHRARRDALLFRFRDDGRRERMLALRFEAGCDGEQLCFVDADGRDARDARPPLRDRAGLVHDDGVDGLCRLERFA